MRRAWYALVVAQGLLLAGCADIDKGLLGPTHGNPPIGHLPGKADLFQCTISDCDQIPVNIQVVGGRCTVPFLYQRVNVQPGVTARFGFAVLTPEFVYRFTDPSNDASTGDPARNLPGIDIDYRGMPPAFSVGYADASAMAGKAPARPVVDRAARARSAADVNSAKYDVTALPGATNKDIYYQFAIHAEWSADHGATWLPCEEKDPVIANN